MSETLYISLYMFTMSSLKIYSPLHFLSQLQQMKADFQNSFFFQTRCISPKVLFGYGPTLEYADQFLIPENGECHGSNSRKEDTLNNNCV